MNVSSISQYLPSVQTIKKPQAAPAQVRGAGGDGDGDADDRGASVKTNLNVGNGRNVDILA